MQKRRLTEQELLKGLDRYRVHADELAELLPHESRPLDPVANLEDWNAWFERGGAVTADDLMKAGIEPLPKSVKDLAEELVNGVGVDLESELKDGSGNLDYSRANHDKSPE